MQIELLFQQTKKPLVLVLEPSGSFSSYMIVTQLMYRSQDNNIIKHKRSDYLFNSLVQFVGPINISATCIVFPIAIVHNNIIIGGE